MSKIIEHFLIPLFVIISVLYAFNSLGTIELNKVYHHKAHDGAYLERANLAFYFSSDPSVQEVGSSTFFFPQAVMKEGECEAMVKKINASHDGYTITIEQVTKPSKGIQLVFALDPNKLVLSYEQFDSIGLQKGVVFRLHSKDLLRQLEQANNQPVLRTLWNNKKPRVVIDFGHGGRDSGAISYDGTQEKDICLAIGTVLGDLLQAEGCDVLLTRKRDCDALLDERTAYANTHHADLFVSIHANYAANPHIAGIETFCLQPRLFKQKHSYASLQENDCIQSSFNQRAQSSHLLAQSIQRNVCDAVALYHDMPIDRGVKFSVAQVLLGTQMPAVLIEVGFLSDKRNADLLKRADYQHDIACGLRKGILAAQLL